MSGKGDNPRPFSVTPEEFGQKFDAIDWTRRAREQSTRDAVVGGTGWLHIDPAAKVSSNQVNAISCTFDHGDWPCAICDKDKP